MSLQNVALPWQSVATTAEEKKGETSEKSSKYEQEKWKRPFLPFVAAKEAGGVLAVVDKGEDLDENDSGVEDASDLDSDVEERQIESLIKKYS